MGAPIITWAEKFGGRTLLAHAMKSPSAIGDRTLPADGVSLETSTLARVSGGRWIADCPVDGCFGAEYVNFDEPVFFCCECRNAAWDNHPIPVELPDEDVRSAVEMLLGARPAPATRNWSPDEPVSLLQEENDMNGITG